MSENGNPQMLRTAKIKIAQIKNPKFSARVFRFFNIFVLQGDI